MQITDDEKLKEVQRELRQRDRVYTRLITLGRMNATAAARQIEVMKAIEADYRAKVGAGPLFGEQKQ